MTPDYGVRPDRIDHLDIHLPEQMHYLYLPVIMDGEYDDVRLPPNVRCVWPMIESAKRWCKPFQYCYLSAVRGIATPGNALNRPGWHCDGFGTNDLNTIWWKGPGTQFAVQRFHDIANDDHDADQKSIAQFEEQILPQCVETYKEGDVLLLSPFVVHSTPVITKTCERQFVKLSFSNERYNLEGNSHNYLFDYDWKMVDRTAARNVTNKDFVEK